MNREIEKIGGAAASALAELIGDPLVGLLMKSDGVDGRSIELLFERIARARPRTAQGCAEAACGTRRP